MCIKITQRGQIFQYVETTQTLCEAQFLLIKDDTLKHQKEVNIVGLLDKLTNKLDHHYKNKLLSISTGKYDGIYSRRFSAQEKNRRGHGFSNPDMRRARNNPYVIS